MLKNMQKDIKIRTRIIVLILLSMFLTCLICGCNFGKEGAVGSSYPPLILAGGTAAATQPAESTELPAVDKESALPAFNELNFVFSGKAYCLANADTGEVYMSHNGDETTYIASITKLIVALTVLDFFSPEQEITVNDEWLELMRNDTDIDGYGIKGGETYTVEDYLKMLIIKSYGDAALVLQYATQEIAGVDFIELMNQKALDFGMSNSHFDNPIGLDVGNGFLENYSTASDVAKLTVKAVANATLFEICCLRETTLSNGTKLVSTVPLYGEEYVNSKYSVLGGKTGSTNASGVSIACVAADLDSDRRYIMVYLNGESSTDMYNEISSLFNQIC